MTQPKTVVVKLGGSTLVAGSADDTTLADMLALQAEGWRVVLVHGGGPQIDAILARLNIERRFHNGLRVTDAATLDAVRYGLLGQVNPDLVATIANVGGQAVGLNGVLRAAKDTRKGDIGFVGNVTGVDIGAINALLDHGYVPVIAPLAIPTDAPDTPALMYNVNADLAAAHIAAVLPSAVCVFLTNVAGVFDGEGRTIPTLDETRVAQLIADGTIGGGMIPKIDAALTAYAAVPRVAIIISTRPHALYDAVANDSVAGTAFRR